MAKKIPVHAADPDDKPGNLVMICADHGEFQLTEKQVTVYCTPGTKSHGRCPLCQRIPRQVRSKDFVYPAKHAQEA